ncbi:hypothetical protein B0J15DRAFT_141411, partial [Fusarium solani]
GGHGQICAPSVLLLGILLLLTGLILGSLLLVEGLLLDGAILLLELLEKVLGLLPVGLDDDVVALVLPVKVETGSRLAVDELQGRLELDHVGDKLGGDLVGDDVGLVGKLRHGGWCWRDILFGVGLGGFGDC